MFKRKIITFVFLLGFLPGCVQKKQPLSLNLKNKDLDEVVAGLTFIPDTPFGFCVHSVKRDVQDSEDAFKVVYHAKKSAKIDLQDLKKSYRTEMELLGWDFVNQFEDESELLLIFARPLHVLCQVRFDRDNFLTILVLKNKKDRF